jgi:hypothetical protein
MSIFVLFFIFYFEGYSFFLFYFVGQNRYVTNLMVWEDIDVIFSLMTLQIEC